MVNIVGSIDHLTITSLEEIAISVVQPNYSPPLIPHGFHWRKEISGAYYWFLYELSKRQKFELMVELGLCSGASALMLALGNTEGKVRSIDINPQFDVINSLSLVAPNIRVQSEDSIEASRHPNLYDSEIGLLFLDTEHNEQHVLSEYIAWSPFVKHGGIILIDDIEWSRPAWDKLPEPKIELPDLHPQVGFGALIKI